MDLKNFNELTFEEIEEKVKEYTPNSRPYLIFLNKESKDIFDKIFKETTLKLINKTKNEHLF